MKKCKVILSRALSIAIFFGLITPSFAVPIFSFAIADTSAPFNQIMNVGDASQSVTLKITNTSAQTLPEMTYTPPAPFTVITAGISDACGSQLGAGQSCNLGINFDPSKIGHYGGQVKVCAGGGIWCSRDPVPFNITVSQTDIAISSCSNVLQRPYASLDCNGVFNYSDNFRQFLAAVVGQAATKSEFTYFQHTLSVDETSTPCLSAIQKFAVLDPEIKGGGAPLCNLLAYASATASDNTATKTKLYPPYMTNLLGTTFPVTTPLNNLGFLNQFGIPPFDTNPSWRKCLGHFCSKLRLFGFSKLFNGLLFISTQSKLSQLRHNRNLSRYLLLTLCFIR